MVVMAAVGAGFGDERNLLVVLNDLGWKFLMERRDRWSLGLIVVALARVVRRTLWQIESEQGRRTIALFRTRVLDFGCRSGVLVDAEARPAISAKPMVIRIVLPTTRADQENLPRALPQGRNNS
jgi:hypothetical protein